ncbi:MAG: hypothetical protein IPM92_14305 [Saprospiraceae bacterium]|nr:hypothetical protein [Saprospiraceae bacterium]
MQYKHIGGDRAVGQAWMMIILGVLFVITTLLLFWMMSRKGYFSWLNEHLSFPNIFTILFCISYIVSVFFSSTFKIEWHSDGGYPLLLRYLSQAHIYLWIPLCVMIPFFFLIRNGGDVGMSFSYVKYPLYVGILLSSLYSGLSFYG